MRRASRMETTASGRSSMAEVSASYLAKLGKIDESQSDDDVKK
jgi:hypothetical protein